MTDRKGLELLRQITGDSNYVNRVSGLDSNRTNGRQWDNRFAATASIPKYDALNDRFCKFAMRRHLATQRSSSLKKPAVAGQLEPLAPQQQRRLWGTHEMPEAPRGGSQDPTSFRGAANAAQGQMKLAPVDQASVANVEALFQKSKQRLQRMWEELATPESQRAAFAQQFFGVPTTENLATINDEIQRLLDERNGAVQIEKAIEIREGFLYLLQELTERYANSSMEKDRAIRELQALVTPYRNSTLEAIEAILRWRELIHSEHQPYLWKGVSYLHKINSDLYFLTQSRLRSLLDFEVTGNPLFDPRRTLSADKLPPLRRGATGVVSKEAAALKDLPKDRIDRADMALQEEARRQRALMAPRPEAVMTTDEASHMRALLTEQQEREQLVVEEEAWQRAQSQSKSTEEIEAAAATKIQATYRAYLARRFVTARLLQRKAAIKMQSIARQFLAKLAVIRLRRQVEAARKLQALQRGISSRSRMAAVRHRHAAAITIQRLYRGYAARRFTDMLRYVSQCAIAIQRVFRGWRERSRVRRVVTNVRNQAATMIQKHWRGFQARRDPRNNRSLVSKTIKLQAWFRGCNTRRAVRNMVLVRYAATLMQSTWRGYAARKRATQLRIAKIDTLWRSHIAKATQATVVIQSAWRMFAAKRLVGAMRAEAEAIRRAEAHAALRQAYAVDENIRKTRSAAAVKIQSVVRGHQGRQRFRLLTLLHLTSIQIQRVVRGFLGRRRAARVAREQLILKSIAVIHQETISNELSPVAAAVSMLRQQQHDATQQPNESHVVKQLGLSESDSACETPAAEPELAPVVEPAQPQQPIVSQPKAVTPPVEELVQVDVPTTTTTPEEPPALHPSASRAATAEEIDISRDIMAAAERILAVKTPEAVKSVVPAPAEHAPENFASKATVEHHHAAAAAVPTPAVTTPAVVSAPAPTVTHKAGDEKRLRARACIIRFFHLVAAVRVVAQKRRSRRQGDRNARAQECEHAARMIQRWVRQRLPVVAAKRLARSVKQVQRSKLSTKVNSQERHFAASIIQRNLMPIASARSIVRKMSEKRTAVLNARTVLLQERNSAAVMIQQVARRWLDRLHHRRVLESRRIAKTATSKAPAQEKEFAALHIQSALRSCLARRERGRRAEVRREAVKKQGEHDAAVIIQNSARFFLHRRETSQQTHEEAAALQESIERERVHAARMIQAVTRRKILLPWRLEQRGARQEAAALEQEAAYASLLSNPDDEDASVTPHDAQVATGASTPEETELMAIQQEREYAAKLIGKNMTPTTRSPSRSPMREASPAVAAAAIAAREQETKFAVGLIQPVGRGYVSRKQLAPRVFQPFITPAQPESLVSVIVSPKADSKHLSQSRSGRARSVSFSSDAREHSRILQEPALDTAADPDLGHEVAHAHDVNHGETPEAAAAATAAQRSSPPPQQSPQEQSIVSNGSMTKPLHHVRFAEPAPAAGEKPAAELSEPVAASKVAATAPVVVLNEYEREKAEKAARARASRVIQSAERQRQARAELERRRATRAQQRSLQRDEETRVAEAAAQEEQRIARQEVDVATLKRQTLAAIRIQCAYRVYNAKFMLQWMQERREEKRRNKADADFNSLLSSSAARIQRMVRGALARIERKRRMKARDLARGKAQTEQRRRERAAITLQCAYRSYNARFETAWRRRDAEIKAAKAIADREATAAALEDAKRRDQELLQKRTKSALVIQCAYRSYNARFAAFLRRQARDLAIATKRHDAAVTVQRMGRGSFERRILGRELLKARNAAASADRARRMSEEKREVARETTTDVVDRATEARRMSQEKRDIAHDATSDAIDKALAGDKQL